MANEIIKYIAYGLIIWNFIVFCMYGVDKRRSIKNKWRISEKTLIVVSFLFGAIGAICGTKVFRHKTQKAKFRILLPTALVVNIIVVWFIIYQILKV